MIGSPPVKLQVNGSEVPALIKVVSIEPLTFCELKVIHLENQKSPGESAFYLEDKKTLFIGDALIGKVPGKLNLLPPEKFADINEARKSLQVLRNFDFEDLFLGDGESILSKGKEALEELLSQ